MNDWRTPFKQLKDELFNIYNNSPGIFHTVIMSVNRSSQDLKQPLSYLELELLGNPPLQDIFLKTEGCQYHCHRFFGSVNTPLFALQRALQGIEEWCNQIPGGMIPNFSIPKSHNQANRDLVHWMSLVYYLAWVSKAPYLEIELEYQLKAEEIGFFPWYECPHPHNWQPLDWLISKRSSLGEIPKWKERFSDNEINIPDIIDAYMTDELIRSSIAAVDILISVLPMERKMGITNQKKEEEKLKTSPPKSKKQKEKLFGLCLILKAYHDPSQSWFDSTNTVTERNSNVALTAMQMALIMGWSSKLSRVADVTARRIMGLIFGKDPMGNYKKYFIGNDTTQPLLEFIDLRLSLIGGEYYSQIPPENAPSRERSTDPGILDRYSGSKKLHSQLNDEESIEG